MTKNALAHINTLSMLEAIWSGIQRLYMRDSAIVLISLVLLTISVSFLFEGTNRWVYWLYDDTEHLSIAYNLFHGKGLTRDFIDMGASSTETNIPHLVLYDQISNSLRSKTPLHLVLLGAWLFITSANHTNWFFLGSIFNFFLGATAVIVFYLFTKRHFGLGIAAYSTPVFALMPPLIWYSVRIRPDLLAFIFITLTFYFVAKRHTIYNTILVGFLCGLAHISHPIGLLPGSALVIYYLLFKHNLKSCAVLLGTWALIVIPWMVRNYLIFGDATQGLGLPIPARISTSLGLIKPEVSSLSSADVGTIAGVPLYQTLVGMLDEFTRLYGMQFFMAFIACSIIAYLSFPAIKRALPSLYFKLLFILVLAAYLRVILWVSSSESLAFQFIIFLLIPLIAYLYIRVLSHHKDIFTNEGKDIYTILAIFAILNFVVYLMFSQTTGRIVPEVRVIIIGLFLLIPVAVIGIKKSVEILYSFLTRSPMVQSMAVGLSLTSILVLYSTIQIFTGIPSIGAYQNRFAESNDMKNTNEWITENIPADAKIASDLPHAILLRTGHEAVNFATAFIGTEDYERWIIKKFDIDYLVFFHGGRYTDESPNYVDLGGIELRQIYRSGESLIYRVLEGDQ